MKRAAIVVALLGGLLIVDGPGVVVAGPQDDPAADPALASLPSVTSGERPGPALLYALPPEAPQLENRDPAFRAAPILVTASERYVDGEYLYQDFLNDDRGADTNNGGDADTGPAEGDVVYPTNVQRYGNNAADLVEVRLAQRRQELVARFTLLTMLEPDAAIVSLYLDTDGDRSTSLPAQDGDPGVAFPGADTAITTWGTGAELVSVRGDQLVRTDLTTSADLEAAQLTVRIPKQVHAFEGVDRWVAVAGLSDGSGGWKRPAEQATENDPGAGVEGVNGIFDLAPSFGEPAYEREVPPDFLQSTRLGANDPMAAAHTLDFDALAAGVNRDLVPKTGRLFRIFPSRFDLGGGRDETTFPQFRQQLEEYATYVPSKVLTGERLGITFYLHSLDRYHWGYSPSPYLKWLGEERGSIVVTPLGRGPNGFYLGLAEADLYEVWNDVARHYRLDPEDAVTFGTSMGGYGAYRMATLHPDLYAKAATNIAPPGAFIWAPPMPPDRGLISLTTLWLDNLRNVPILNMVSPTDELVPITGTKAQNLGAPEFDIRGLEQLGYRYRFRLYEPSEHISLSLSYDRVVPQFLSHSRVDRDPFHVTYRYVPAADMPEYGIVRDHSYWLSEIRVRADAGPAPAGALASRFETPPASALIDAVTQARGLADPSSKQTASAGVPNAEGFLGIPLAYQEFTREWGAPIAVPARNALTLDVSGVASLTVDAPRAGLRLDQPLHLTVVSDGQTVITISGPRGSRSVTVEAGRTELVLPPS